MGRSGTPLGTLCFRIGWDKAGVVGSILATQQHGRVFGGQSGLRRLYSYSGDSVPGRNRASSDSWRRGNVG